MKGAGHARGHQGSPEEYVQKRSDYIASGCTRPKLISANCNSLKVGFVTGLRIGTLQKMQAIRHIRVLLNIKTPSTCLLMLLGSIHNINRPCNFNVPII